MNLSVSFVFGNILLGVGLAMDAFSVSMANGLNDPKMKRSGIVRIAGAFGLFQFLMPMLGWVCVHTIVQYFSAFQKAIPWIALGLLGWIGGKMLYEGIKPQEADAEAKSLSHGDLLMQAIATSIDALSVGFTIAEYGALSAFLASVIIAAVTFVICVGGVLIGRKAGTKLSGKASILGGVILILIGIEIFVSNMIG